MRLLLDTHVWLWLQTAPGRLSASVLDTLRDLDNDLFLSAVSAWEIAVKHALGRLPLPEPPATYVPARMHVSGVRPLSVTHDHALAGAALPQHHRDPFDRLLVAQAQRESLQLVTVDGAFADYDVEVLWAAR